MSKAQTEKPGITPAELCAAVGLSATVVAGTKVSSGPFAHFKKGWAVNLMADPGHSAHWFSRTGAADAARALCSHAADVRWLYGPGNYNRCQNCIRVMTRRIERGPPL